MFEQDKCAEPRLAGMNPSRESGSLYLYVPNGPSVDKMKTPIIDVAVRRHRRISGAGSSSVEMTEALGSPRVDHLVVPVVCGSGLTPRYYPPFNRLNG